MPNRTKQRVVGGAGSVLGGIWSLYAAFTTAASLPTDAAGLAKMMADPPAYFPYLLLAVGVFVFAWSFWPAKQDEPPPETGRPENVAERGGVIQRHSGVGHNINAHSVTLGSQFLEPKPEVFAHLAEHLRMKGIKGVNLHSLSDGNSIRILDAAKAYFEKAGFEIKGEKIVTLLSKAMPAPFFINETTIKDDVADVWFDGGTPLDRFPGRGQGSL